MRAIGNAARLDYCCAGNTMLWVPKCCHRPASLCLLAGGLLLESGIRASAQVAPPSPAPFTNAPVREISPGIFQIGGVRLDKARHTVTFPAAVNMSAGVIEYLLVTSTGKTHESLLRTDIDPHHLQVAMLLLGAKAAARTGTNPPATGPVLHDRAKPQRLTGDPVTIELSWTNDGKTRRANIEEFIFNRRAKAPMTRGPFTFTGSRVWEGKFLAQSEGSLIAVVTDELAMFNNPRPGADDDETWEILTAKTPPVKTPVEVKITLKSNKAKAAEQPKASRSSNQH
ncbi:MAG: hypothetical protein HZA89_04145 [Verrucomicrobia bacterium]|nr:hypothetical protein [Verrucomicrobiota bacterium]